MADDKRAEAMRKAIEQADAADAKKKAEKAKKGKQPGEGGGGSIKLGGKEFDVPFDPAAVKEKIANAKLPGVTGDGGKGTGNVADLAGSAKRTAGKVWSSRNGRFAVIGAVALVLILIAGRMLAGGIGAQQNAGASYRITDSLLSVYRNESYGSGYAWDAYVEIKNTGSQNLYMSDMIFLIQTEKGEEVMRDDKLTCFPAVLQPGEHGYIYNRFGSELVYSANTSERLETAYPGIADGSVALDLRVSATVNPSTRSVGNYVVDENSVTIEPGLNGGKAMTASIVNDSGSRGTELSVFFVTYVEDDDGDDGLKCSGITFQRLESLAPHATVQVRMDPVRFVHSLRNAEVVDWKMYVYD